MTFADRHTHSSIIQLSINYNIKDKDKFAEEIFNISNNIFLSDLKLVVGSDDFIKNSNKKHFIGSNSTKERIIKGLNLVKLSNLFLAETVYSFDMVKNPKPEPDIYIKILRENSLNIDETIVIEDSGVGVKAANSAGIKVYGITAGKHWHSNRDQNELYNNGALKVFDSYKNLKTEIESL